MVRLDPRRCHKGIDDRLCFQSGGAWHVPMLWHTLATVSSVSLSFFFYYQCSVAAKALTPDWVFSLVVPGAPMLCHDLKFGVLIHKSSADFEDLFWFGSSELV